MFIHEAFYRVEHTKNKSVDGETSVGSHGLLTNHATLRGLKHERRSVYVAFFVFFSCVSPTKPRFRHEKRHGTFHQGLFSCFVVYAIYLN